MAALAFALSALPVALARGGGWKAAEQPRNLGDAASQILDAIFEAFFHLQGVHLTVGALIAGNVALVVLLRWRSAHAESEKEAYRLTLLNRKTRHDDHDVASPVPTRRSLQDLQADGPAKLLVNKGGGMKRRTSDHNFQVDEPIPPPFDAPTMEEIAERRRARHDETYAMSPLNVLNDMIAGNTRFWTGKAHRPELSAMERRALILQQAPKVAIVGCSDSRVPIEIVFDQGLGDVFAIRVAGNAVRPLVPVGDVEWLWIDPVRASVDYAVHHLKCKLVVVLGHEGCGAVKAAQTMDAESLAKETPTLRSFIGAMQEDLKLAAPDMSSIKDTRAREREAVVTNAKLQAKRILEDPRLASKAAEGQLLVVGAFYEITTGIVEFLDVPTNAQGHAI